MPILSSNKPASATTRRWFGLSLGAVFGLLSWTLGGGSTPIGLALACTGLIVALVYYTLPQTRNPIIATWQRLTYPIAWCVGHLLMLLIFFGLFLHIGILLRLSGYDPLGIRPRDADSFWSQRRSAPERKNYFRQF